MHAGGRGAAVPARLAHVLRVLPAGSWRDGAVLAAQSLRGAAHGLRDVGREICQQRLV